MIAYAYVNLFFYDIPIYFYQSQRIFAHNLTICFAFMGGESGEKGARWAQQRENLSLQARRPRFSVCVFLNISRGDSLVKRFRVGVGLEVKP